MEEREGAVEEMVDRSPLVSIIINVFNGEEFLVEAIESVFAQTFDDWEIILWDNASTDRTPEIARRYGGKLRYFKSPETYSLGQARNMALAQARGAYIGFLDHDDLWCPQKLEKQLALFRSRPDIGLVFSNVEFFEKGKAPFLFFLHRQPPQGMVFGALLRSYFLPMPAVMVRRDAVRQDQGWFDERFSIVEEADLFMRIAHDHPVGYCPGTLARVRYHRGNLTARRQDLFARESELLLEKLQALWPDMEQQYHDELVRRREGIQCHYGILAWERGDGAEARRRFRPYLKLFSVRWVVYLLSYFPYPVYKCFKDVYFALVHSFRGKFGGNC